LSVPNSFQTLANSVAAISLTFLINSLILSFLPFNGEADLMSLTQPVATRASGFGKPCSTKIVSISAVVTTCFAASFLIKPIKRSTSLSIST